MIDEQTLESVIEFHGHMCPGLAMGIQAAEIALREIGAHAKDEEVVAVVETDMCGVDAIQFLTGCTFGKGNLIHRDWGKNAFSFFRRSDGRAVRVSMRPGAWEPDPEHQSLFAKIRDGQATDADQARFQELHVTQSHKVLAVQPDSLYAVDDLRSPLPNRARIHASVVCADCGEGTMETRVHRFDGRELCSPCFDAALSLV
jgi:formylmethanofuran dehydrogenase subunit E